MTDHVAIAITSKLVIDVLLTTLMTLASFHYTQDPRMSLVRPNVITFGILLVLGQNVITFRVVY